MSVRNPASRVYYPRTLRPGDKRKNEQLRQRMKGQIKIAKLDRARAEGGVAAEFRESLKD